MSRVTYKDYISKDGLLALESLAADGLTNKEIAETLGLKYGTFSNWISRYSEISEALKKGRRPVVRQLENKLIETAMGYDYQEGTQYIEVAPNGTKITKQIIHKKKSLPNVTALMFLLKNYKPEKYRNYTESSKRQIDAEARKLEAEATILEREAERVTSAGEVNDLLEALIEVVQHDD